MRGPRNFWNEILGCFIPARKITTQFIVIHSANRADNLRAGIKHPQNFVPQIPGAPQTCPYRFRSVLFCMEHNYERPRFVFVRSIFLPALLICHGCGDAEGAQTVGDGVELLWQGLAQVVVGRLAVDSVDHHLLGRNFLHSLQPRPHIFFA